MYDINVLVNEITSLVSYGAGVGVILGLSEWLVKFFLSMVLDRFNYKG